MPSWSDSRHDDSTSASKSGSMPFTVVIKVSSQMTYHSGLDVELLAAVPRAELDELVVRGAARGAGARHHQKQRIFEHLLLPCEVGLRELVSDRLRSSHEFIVEAVEKLRVRQAAAQAVARDFDGFCVHAIRLSPIEKGT